MSEEGLTAGKVLERTYEKLAKRNEHEIIELPEKSRSLIADDSDWHRTRKGYMQYETVNLFENLSERNWLVGNGKAVGSYPARPYVNDILAIDFQEPTQLEEIMKKRDKENLDEEEKERLGKLKNNKPYRAMRKIEDTLFFKNSLFFSKKNGLIGASKKSQLGQELIERVDDVKGKYIAQAAEFGKGMLTANLEPVTKQTQMYKPELVDYLVENTEDVLIEYGGDLDEK